jgi:hypothetical protein
MVSRNQVAAGIEHAVDLGTVLGPLFDFVEVAVVRVSESLVSSSDLWVLTPVGSYFDGRSPMSRLSRFSLFNEAP